MQAERPVNNPPELKHRTFRRILSSIPRWMVPNRLVHGLSAVCFSSGLTWALLTPDPFALLRETPIGWIAAADDMFQHMGAFCILSLTVLTLCFRLTGTVSPAVVAVLGSHAVLTEILQAEVPGRTCDPTDALANFAGILLSVTIMLRVTSNNDQPVVGEA